MNTVRQLCCEIISVSNRWAPPFAWASAQHKYGQWRTRTSTAHVPTAAPEEAPEAQPLIRQGGLAALGYEKGIKEVPHVLVRGRHLKE